MYYTVIKHSSHLRTLEKCRKHSPAARAFHISLVFSNACRVLSQCNTQLRLLYLLNTILYATAKSHQETLGTLTCRGNTRNANNATPRNTVQPITPETLKLSRKCYRPTSECHSHACSWLLTKLNTFNLM